jgi:hypothetical protein
MAMQKWVEKRLKVRSRDDVPKGYAKINPETMKILNITDEVEGVVAGKRKFIYKAMPSESVPVNEVWCNAEEMKVIGIADGTVTTIRKPLAR